MTRVQLALNVDHLGESIAFYSKLFGTKPAKLRPGYANFAIAEPPVKLSSRKPWPGRQPQSPAAWRLPTPTPSTLSRPGWPKSGLAAVEERETTCCYAKQDKFWVQGTPDGERWEIYAVTGDSQTFWGEDGEAAARKRSRLRSMRRRGRSAAAAERARPSSRRRSASACC